MAGPTEPAQITNTFESPSVQIDAPITVNTPEHITNIDGDTINVLPGVAPDVTILPTEVTVNVPTPEPSKGVVVLYNPDGTVAGTTPRSLPKPDLKLKKESKK
jgi:hypothetical protein